MTSTAAGSTPWPVDAAEEAGDHREGSPTADAAVVRMPGRAV